MSRRPSIRRTISSRSLTPQIPTPPLDDDFSIGDSEIHIEYHNVPKRLLVQGAIHTLIQFRFFPLLLVIISCILLIILFFSGIYFGISDSCSLALDSFPDAFLFAFLAHVKAALSPPEDHNRFWNGCFSGSVSLFFHLFVGHILSSVLLSSLAFNFQSISRRSISMFTTLSVSKSAGIQLKTPSQASLVISVVELNENASRKVSDVTANIFVFDPVDTRIRSVASNVQIGDVFLPQSIEVDVPMDLVLNELESVVQSCPVCGKRAPLNQHLQAAVDVKHREMLRQLKKQPSARLEVLEVVNRLRRREVEFIVIIEGSDSVTTDRIQVQKIFRGFDIVGLKSDFGVVTYDVKTHSPGVDYSTFH